MEAIFSKTNENVKFVRSLNEKKYRMKNKAFYLEGIKVVNEILDNEQAVNTMFIAYSKSILIKSNGGKELLNKIEKIKDIKVLEFEESIFKYMTDTVSPQGVLIVLKIKDNKFEDLLKNNKGNILVLDKVQDMGNIGTIIRSCNAFDVNLVVCMSGTADVYAPKVIRSTMGGILNINIVYLDDIQELAILKKYGYKIVSTILNTDKNMDILSNKEKYAFVMGNEANGISQKIIDISDIYVKIPMTDKIESLNVGVATSIILYEQYKNKTSR